MPHFPLEDKFIFAHRLLGLKIFRYVLTGTQMILDNTTHKARNKDDLFLWIALHSAAVVLQLCYLSAATSWVLWLQHHAYAAGHILYFHTQPPTALRFTYTAGKYRMHQYNADPYFWDQGRNSLTIKKWHKPISDRSTGICQCVCMLIASCRGQKGRFDLLLNRCLSRTVRKEAEIIECFSNRPLSNEERWLTHTKFSFQPVTPHNKWTRISTALTNTQLSPLARCRSSKQPVLAEKRKHNMQNLPTRAWVLPAKSPLLRYTKQQVNIWKRVEAKGDPMLSALIHTASLLQSPEYLLASHSNQLKVEFLVTGTRNLQVSSSVWKDFPCTLSHLW